MEKSGKKMFHALHKVDMHTCYAKQKINLACPKTSVDGKWYIFRNICFVIFGWLLICNIWLTVVRFAFKSGLILWIKVLIKNLKIKN